MVLLMVVVMVVMVLVFGGYFIYLPGDWLEYRHNWRRDVS
jgi:hypothetical protein